MSQPEGFVDEKHPDHVCLLKKSLYGLKQSPHQWNKKFDDYMLSLNFARSFYDPCLYIKDASKKPVLFLLYVDDMLHISPSLDMINKV